MAGVDVVRIEEVLNDESARMSKYYKHQEIMDSKAKQRFKVFVERAVKYRQNPSIIDLWEDEFEAEVMKYALPDTKETYLHMDMDAFFANVEIRDNPAYASLPVAVGSLSMISTSNYIARKFGVRAAMAGFIALKLCPDLIIIPCNYEKYQAVGAEIREKVLSKYDQDFKSFSCDEATLHITSYCEHNNVSPSELGQRIKDDIFALTGLTCSIGIGPNPIISKMAAEYKKPCGFHALQFITTNEMRSFLHQLPIRKVPFLGKRAENLLAEIGILDLGDIYHNRGLLWGLLPRKTAMSYILCPYGIFGMTSSEDSEFSQTPKRALCPSISHSSIGLELSISKERTFGAISSKHELLCVLERVVSDILEYYSTYALEFSVNTVTLKLKNEEFEIRQRSLRLTTPTKSMRVLLEVAHKILAWEYYPIDIRLLGVKFTLQEDANVVEAESKLCDGGCQGFDSEDDTIIQVSHSRCTKIT